MKNFFITFLLIAPLFTMGQVLTFENEKAKELVIATTADSIDVSNFVVFKAEKKISTKQALREIKAGGLRPASPAEVIYYFQNVDDGKAVISPQPIGLKDGLFTRKVVFGIYEGFVSLPSFRGQKWCQDIIFLAVRE